MAFYFRPSSYRTQLGRRVMVYQYILYNKLIHILTVYTNINADCSLTLTTEYDSPKPSRGLVIRLVLIEPWFLYLSEGSVGDLLYCMATR